MTDLHELIGNPLIISEGGEPLMVLLAIEDYAEIEEGERLDIYNPPNGEMCEAIGEDPQEFLLKTVGEWIEKEGADGPE